jgi:hypothetical protein
MRNLAAILVCLSVSCTRGPSVPVNTMLWRLDTPWTSAAGRPDVRTAQATIIVFREGHEYVELHTPVIEQADTTVYLQAGRPRAVVIGRWQVRDDEIVATRQRVARTRLKVAVEPLCVPPQLTFRVTGKSMRGNAGGPGVGDYSPVTRLVAPDIESHVQMARDSSVICPASEP